MLHSVVVEPNKNISSVLCLITTFNIWVRTSSFCFAVGKGTLILEMNVAAGADPKLYRLSVHR